MAFARLRRDAVIGSSGKIGNFVEVKNSVIGSGSKASHLSYIGDADLGEGVNVGAGTITCNYDGYLKHRTRVGDGAFIGSNTSLVAPVEIGEGAIVGAGSTITKTVEPDAIATARSVQKQHAGAAKRFRSRREREKLDA